MPELLLVSNGADVPRRALHIVHPRLGQGGVQGVEHRLTGPQRHRLVSQDHLIGRGVVLIGVFSAAGAVVVGQHLDGDGDAPAAVCAGRGGQRDADLLARVGLSLGLRHGKGAGLAHIPALAHGVGVGPGGQVIAEGSRRRLLRLLPQDGHRRVIRDDREGHRAVLGPGGLGRLHGPVGEVKQPEGQPRLPVPEGGDQAAEALLGGEGVGRGPEAIQGVADIGQQSVHQGGLALACRHFGRVDTQRGKGHGGQAGGGGVPHAAVRPLAGPHLGQGPVHGLLHQSVAVTVGGQRQQHGRGPVGAPGCIAPGVLAVHRRLDQVIHLRLGGVALPLLERQNDVGQGIRIGHAGSLAVHQGRQLGHHVHLPQVGGNGLSGVVAQGPQGNDVFGQIAGCVGSVSLGQEGIQAGLHLVRGQFVAAVRPGGGIGSQIGGQPGAIAVARHAGGRIPGRDVVQDLPGPNRGDRHCKYLSQALQPRSRKGGYQCNGLLLGPPPDHAAAAYNIRCAGCPGNGGQPAGPGLRQIQIRRDLHRAVAAPQPQGVPVRLQLGCGQGTADPDGVGFGGQPSALRRFYHHSQHVDRAAPIQVPEYNPAIPLRACDLRRRLRSLSQIDGDHRIPRGGGCLHLDHWQRGGKIVEGVFCLCGIKVYGPGIALHQVRHDQTGQLVGRAGLHRCGQGCRSLNQFVGVRVGAIEGAPLLRDILQPEPHIGLIQPADQCFSFRNGLLQSRLFRVGKGGGVPCLGLLQGGPGLVQRI
ncbi:Uncharacterised protein [Flavonifractor plautii]|nr:Uncharacterised protein [Flavonifractor plautii]